MKQTILAQCGSTKVPRLWLTVFRMVYWSCNIHIQYPCTEHPYHRYHTCVHFGAFCIHTYVHMLTRYVDMHIHHMYVCV